MKNPSFLFAFLWVIFLPSRIIAQTEEAELVLVASQKWGDTEYLLSRFEGDGQVNTSSSSGAGFYISGGTLIEIFDELWPSYEFEIHRKFSNQYFRLEIKSTQDLDEQLLDDIWNSLGESKSFSSEMNSSLRKGSCLEIVDKSLLLRNKYTPINGVVKRDQSRGRNLDLEGYTVSDLVEKLNQSKAGRIFYEETQVNSATFSFRVDASNLSTISESLEAYGLQLEKCEKMIKTYSLE